MCQLNAIIVVLLVPFYVSNAANLPVEDTTDALVDNYDPNSDETFDPQRDYADFKSSYEKLYKMSGPGFVLPSSLQQKSWQSLQQIPLDEADPDVDADDSTNPSDMGQGPNDITTTLPPQIEQQTTFAENGAMRSMNDIVKSTPRPIALISYEQSMPNAELLMRKPFDSTTDSKSDDDLTSETGHTAQLAPVVFVQNEANIHNESADYVNDEAIETNYSQPITSIPFPMDTTITSLPSSPVFISTRPPTNLFPMTSTVAIAGVAIQPTVATQTTSAQALNPPPGKKSKKIEALPRIYKYSADEIVRKYLDDTFLRAPLATLINTAPEPLRKAKMLWKSALRPNTPIDIILVAFNSSGVGVTYTFKNTRTMVAGLESVQESREMLEGGSGFYGILRASELVPYDSAIFISTDKIPQDISLMKNAATILLKKRIRLYLIWFGDEEIEENETSIGGALGEVALRSGGEILRITEESIGNGGMGLVTHFLQNDIQGAQVLEIPINTTDTNLHIKIQGNVDQATLTTPIGGEKINLLDVDSVASFSTNSRAIYSPSEGDQYAYLTINLSLLDSPNGVYTLTVTPDIVSGTFDKYNLEVETEYDRRPAKDSFDTSNGETLSDYMLRSKRSEELSEAHDEDTIAWPEPQTDNDIDNNIGNNIDDQQQSNVTEIASRNGKSTLQSVTKIDLGAQSQLLASPGSTVQIHYEVTNLREVPSVHFFQVVDDQRFLTRLNPMSMSIMSGQTQNVILTCYIPTNVQVGTTDRITFTSHGVNYASQTAILTVVSPQATAVDRRPPQIYWKYGSRCYGHTDAGRCAGSVWSVEITTFDLDTGILRLQSNPRGLLFRDRYTAGTTQEVKATYSASCCTPRVTITSFDLAGNQKTITLDVTEYYLEPIEIVAIVLGVILLLIIIAAIIWAIVWCCKKHRNARELPVYRGRADRDRST